MYRKTRGDYNTTKIVEEHTDGNLYKESLHWYKCKVSKDRETWNESRVENLNLLTTTHFHGCVNAANFIEVTVVKPTFNSMRELDAGSPIIPPYRNFLNILGSIRIY